MHHVTEEYLRSDYRENCECEKRKLLLIGVKCIYPVCSGFSKGLNIYLQITRIAYMPEQSPHTKGVETFSENESEGRFEIKV
jgi:hypothetical protein